ncbi:low temperature requirement protein A [Streptomyces rhizosphaerihabitans]|uniref:low temperature requirement protein A n=1 Tax=Streptomyces rhizosphaerihabitans TaxID=1266770 RepID=UPI0021C11123|nr:low temperature requirement protein A [Streptomyces rhizosphaerihabitans]MCT9009166.1 low temperature requirement protein A [Streptomyces rhizosphaerihabitans]
MTAWGLLVLAYLAGFVFMMGWATPVRAVALSVTDLLAERFGLFIIIVLGETVVGVVEGLSHEPTNALTIAVGLVAVVVSFGSWWTYFDFAGHRLPRPTRASTAQWLLVQLPLTAAMASMGAASVGFVEHAHDGRTPAAVAWTLCGGAALVLGTTMVLATSLRVWREDRELYRPLAGTCAVAALMAVGLDAVRPAPLVLGLVLVVLLGIPWLLAMAGRPARDEPVEL